MTEHIVYELIDFEGKVFYVGKTRDMSRPLAHIMWALFDWHYNTELETKIRECCSNEGEIQCNIVFLGSEDECCEEEIRLIAFYGLQSLTNISEGGRGQSGPKISQRRLEQYKTGQRKIYKRTPEIIEKCRQAALQREVSQREAWAKLKYGMSFEDLTLQVAEECQITSPSFRKISLKYSYAIAYAVWEKFPERLKSINRGNK